jgi:hypothetical protein
MYEINISLRFVLCLIALIVSFIAGKVAFERAKYRHFDRNFRFSIAIMLGWIGHLCLTLMALTGNYALIDHSQAEKNGWSVPFLTLMLISAGVIHIQTLSGEDHSKLWLYSLLAGSIVGLVSYWFMI